MVRAELKFKAILCPFMWWNHHSGIVDQHIKPVITGFKLFCKFLYRFKVRQVEVHHNHRLRSVHGPDLCSGLLPFLPVPYCKNHLSTL